jgi:hypothetical protein
MRWRTTAVSPESTSAALSYLVNLNDDAVALLLSKNYAQAASRLSTAIAVLKTLADATPKDTAASGDPMFQFDLLDCSHVEGQDIDLNQAGSMFVFQNPIRIRIRYEHTSSGSITDLKLNQISLAVAYNLALAWHVGAVESADSSQLQLLQRRLSKAQGFYSMALDLVRLMRTTVAGSLSNSGMATVAPVVGLAILNNQAYINHFLGRVEEAETSQSVLMSHLMFVSSRNTLHEKELSPRMNYYLQRFFATALLQASRFAAAA